MTIGEELKVEAALGHEEGYEEDKNIFDDINFDEIDEDLATFQQDATVQQALQRGIDLKKYGHELEKELKQVSIPCNISYNRP